MMGRKTAQVVNVLAAIAPATVLVPSATASMRSFAPDMRRRMLSTTTMALSTSMPAPRASPPSVITLRLCPPKCMRNSVLSSETGTAVATITVGPAERRNSTSTRTARAMPISAAPCTSSMASSTSVASSATATTSTLGRSASSPSSASRTVRETATVLLPASL